jgi:hypothetical protein
MSKKIKILFMMLLIICSICSYNKVYATNNSSISETIGIIDENGNDMTYMPGRMGGNYGWIDTNLKYENCKYAIRLPAENEEQYEDTIIIEGLGTFKFEQKVDSFYSPNGYLENVSKYIYTADITDYSILEAGKDKEYNLKIKNITTGDYQELCLTLSFFTDQFESNANLSYKRT